MKNILATIVMALALTGCHDVDNSNVDLSWLFPEPQIVEVPVEVPCEETECDCNKTINGLITDITDKLDTNSIKMNHYIDKVKVEENMAEVVDIDGDIVTKNMITLPVYEGHPIKHTLIIEFYQVK